MINAGSINSPTYDGNWTWYQFANATHITGGEVWNHAMTHQSFNTVDEADYEITHALETLRTNLPTLTVDGWAGPGQPLLMGMEGYDTPDKFYGTYPGRLVLNQHAFVRGYYPNPFQPLDGGNLEGTGHVTIDKQKNGRIQQYIRRVLNTDTGVTLMLHPNYLDQQGYITTNELASALAYIARLRDTNQLEVLSPTGILMANATVDEHHGSLLQASNSGKLNGELTESVEDRGTLGVPHEIEVWLTGEGEATLSIDIDSPTHPVSKQIVVPLSEEPRRLSIPVTPPLDATNTLSLIHISEPTRRS